MLVYKDNVLRIPKIYRNLSLLFFFFDVFKTEISKNDKNGKP